MNSARRALLVGAAASGLVGLVPGQSGWAATNSRQRSSFQIATDDIASAFYAVGVSLSALVKMRLPTDLAVDLYPLASLGSWQNALMLRARRADFVMMEALFGQWARQGTGVFRGRGPDTTMRAVAGLWPSVEHVLMLSRLVATGTVADLRNIEGAPFSVGPRGSGTEAGSHLILRRAGIQMGKSLVPVNAAAMEGASGMLMGTVSGMLLEGGPPVSSVDAVLSHDPAAVRILDFTDRQLAEVDRGLGLFRRHVIAPGTYPGQEQPVQTIAQPTFLAVRADVPADVVHAVTKAMFENLDVLQNGHPAAAAISAETAVKGLPVPLHEGAARYFSEIGLDAAAK